MGRPLRQRIPGAAAVDAVPVRPDVCPLQLGSKNPTASGGRVLGRRALRHLDGSHPLVPLRSGRISRRSRAEGSVPVGPTRHRCSCKSFYLSSPESFQILPSSLFTSNYLKEGCYNVDYCRSTRPPTHRLARRCTSHSSCYSPTHFCNGTRIVGRGITPEHRIHGSCRQLAGAARH